MPSCAGTVAIITTDSNGTTRVTIQKGDTNESFEHRRDMSDEQLDEFKRAQNNGLEAGVNWEEAADGSRPIDAVLVFREVPGDDDEEGGG
jgi:hypothetical protein